MVRYGTWLALGTLILFVWLTFFLRYPDAVEDDIRISFTQPPSHLVAAKSGYIDKVLVNNNDEVKQGQTLLVFKSIANYNHVLHLLDLIQNLPDESDSTLLRFSPDESLELGELQEDFFHFLEKKAQFERRSEQFTEQDDVQTLEGQKRTLEQRIRFYRNREQALNASLEKKKEEQAQKEQLVRDNRIPYREVQKVKAQITELEVDLQKLEELISDKRIEISILNTQISRAERGVSENRETASEDLKEAFIQLRIRVEEWVRYHVIQSPMDGMVQITGNKIGKQQFILAQDEVMVVLPVSNRQLLGRMDLAFNGSGTVREDQEVVIRLKAYPFPEYGAIIGRVAWKSKVPNSNSRIPVQVVFPNGLITTTGHQIDPGEELFGRGKIITNEKRFVDRIVDRTRNIRM